MEPVLLGHSFMSEDWRQFAIGAICAVGRLQKPVRFWRDADSLGRHQSDGLDLELAAELPSRHIHSPVPWSRSYLRVHETSSRPVEDAAS